MSSFNQGRERPKRADDFLKDLRKYTPRVRVPDPAKDFGMYERMDIAFAGISEHFEELRGNNGRVGYGSQNDMSDLSKDSIEMTIELSHDDGDGQADVEEDKNQELMEDSSYNSHARGKLTKGLKEASLNGALAETGNRFSRTVWHEHLEAELFGNIWPVITGKKDAVSKIVSWKDFEGNVQAYVYGFSDLISEMGKALDLEIHRPAITVEKEFTLFERYLPVAESIMLHLSRERHVPGYVINNAYGHWAAYSSKLYNAKGCIAHVRDKYNLRRFNERLQERSEKRMLEQIAKMLKG